jgi:hypothetical protein
MLVKDSRKLPGNIVEIDDCASLWLAGKSANGTLVEASDSVDMNISVQGRSKRGLRIVGMRARITKRVPTPDGVLLLCPPEPRAGAPQEPVHISFDFRQADSADTDVVRAVREGEPEDDKDAGQFEEDYSISLSENESVELVVSTDPSIDDIDWHNPGSPATGRLRRGPQRGGTGVVQWPGTRLGS